MDTEILRGPPAPLRSASVSSRDLESPPGPRAIPVKFVVLFLVFSAELLALSYVQIPYSMSFDHFGFCDHGANLTLQYLVSNGYRPTVDFGSHYGLLPILAGRFWFTLVGRSASGYQSAMIACNILAAWGIATIIAEFRVGIVGTALTMIVLGYAVQPSYPNLAQAMEAVLLIFAMARQSQGATASALAFSGAAIFAKPAMGYLYSSLLILLIANRMWRQRASVRAWVKIFAPAALVCLALAAVLSATYGIRLLVNTIFPVEGAVNYRALNFGFIHGAGREFWSTPGIPWWGHLFDVSGFWIVSAILLTYFAAADAFRLWQEPAPTNEQRRKTEVIVTCATLHLSFVLLFFGSRGSWIYYSYLLVIGITLAVDSTRFRRDLGMLLCAVAVCSWTDLVIAIHHRRATMRPSALTRGLWATPEEQSEWSSVMALAEGKTTRILDSKGDAELMFPVFGPPVTLYLDPGLMRPAEIAQKISQLNDAQLIIVPMNVSSCSGIPDAPEFRGALKHFDLAWSGTHFEVFRRDAVP